MPGQLDALHLSVERLHDLVDPMDDASLERSAYPAEWTVADVMSHLGSGGVILQRRIDDTIAGVATPDEFAPSVWEVWNSKSPRAKASDGLVADQAALDAIDSMTESQRSEAVFKTGPMSFDFEQFIGLRVNEHTLHTWDIAVAFDPGATLPADEAAVVVDQLDLIGRFTAKPTEHTTTIAIRTTDPQRDFVIALAPDAVTFEAGPASRGPDLTLPAEALIRLVYGRLDPDHTPAFDGDATVLDELRRVYPGP